MLLSAVSVLVVAQSISEIPEGLMNNSVLELLKLQYFLQHVSVYIKRHQGAHSLRLAKVTVMVTLKSIL